MHRKLIAVVAIVITAGVAAGLATARGAAHQQQIALTYVNGNAAAMTLTPLTSGSVQSDTGSTDWCCWTQTEVNQDGEQLDVNNPRATFVGQHGTLVWRERITWHDLGNNYSVATGTWKIVRGTGAYEHLAGHGHLVFIQQSDKTLAFRAVALVTPSGS